MAWWKRAKPAPPPPPTRFWTSAEATAARREIEQLIAGFLAKQLAAGREAPIHSGFVMVNLSKDGGKEEFSVCSPGYRGWTYCQDGFYGIAVNPEGGWRYAGYHTYRANGKTEHSGWSAGPGSWPTIASFEVTHVTDRGTASPASVVHCLQQAIRYWEGR